MSKDFDELMEARRKRLLEIEEAKKQKKDNKTYKLIAFFDPFCTGVDWGFVYPIFQCEDDGKYYFEDGKEDQINYFEEMGIFLPEKFKFELEKISLEGNYDTVYKKGSDTIGGYRISKDKFFVGNKKELKEFLRNNVSEEILKEEIYTDFLNS